ncbi:putative fatty-acid--CoA ligase [Gordonia hirsuta DSM 44140 = NBRC 16056]|uniref:Putative fatty-acid--CoA ligase n=1 Tax=Gordonia hirsuta DSM 44140 = NBRC 16056 TaxID=1121927 RepID=L7LB09_9ACTN|nr:FadD3 family acyl-CoA ligase [Gordonia hirsuta]GAC57926.1 putative fatty-acid--CoA ligase [Gordonia hirsuta DSM 44140 = NBRC 16056]
MSPTPSTTPAALHRARERWPDAPAIRDHQWDRPVDLSWSELAELAETFAGALVELGVEPGDRVAVWAPNSWHWPVAALGTHCAGAVLVPLNTRYTVTEARDIVDRSGALVVVAAGEFAGVDRLAEVLASPLADHRTVIGIPLVTDLPAAGSAVDLLGWDAFLAAATPASIAIGRSRAAAVAPDDLSDILFTSGTTGAPKGVLAEHRQTVAGAHAWGANGGLGPGDRYLMVNPFFHTFGYKAGILPAVLFGTTMHPLAVYSPARARELVAAERITVFPGAPTIFQTILDDPDRTPGDLDSLRLIVTGATIVPVVLIERLQQLGVDTVITAYGQTETSGFITTCTAGDDALTVATTCGRPYPGMQVRLGRNDEVLARGAMVMRGYLNDPEATAAAVDADGWLHTGDIGRLDEHGNLSITDRLKDMYICGGFNVYPAEVEQTLVRVPGITEAAVIGVPDERLGEVGKAYLTRRPDAVVTVEEVLEYAAAHLANFKVPRTVEFVDDFPRNASGKILKRDLS